MCTLYPKIYLFHNWKTVPIYNWKTIRYKKLNSFKDKYQLEELEDFECEYL